MVRRDQFPAGAQFHQIAGGRQEVVKLGWSGPFGARADRDARHRRRSAFTVMRTSGTSVRRAGYLSREAESAQGTREGHRLLLCRVVSAWVCVPITNSYDPQPPRGCADQLADVTNEVGILPLIMWAVPSHDTNSRSVG